MPPKTPSELAPAKGPQVEQGDVDRSEIKEGRYANYFEVGHNAFEFMLDFGQMGPQDEPIRMHIRVITTPPGARKLSSLLGEALHQYRESFGPIHDDEDIEP